MPQSSNSCHLFFPNPEMASISLRDVTRTYQVPRFFPLHTLLQRHQLSCCSLNTTDIFPSNFVFAAPYLECSPHFFMSFFKSHFLREHSLVSYLKSSSPPAISYSLPLHVSLYRFLNSYQSFYFLSLENELQEGRDLGLLC